MHCLAPSSQSPAVASSMNSYSTVWRAIKHIWKNPELYCYDTALRIGAKLGLKPDKVYLHRGTRVDARRLGLPTEGATLEMSALPEGLQGGSRPAHAPVDRPKDRRCGLKAFPRR